MKRIELLCALALAACLPAHAREIRVTPANPTALEFVQVSVDLSVCERMRFSAIAPGEGNRNEISLLILRDDFSTQCDATIRVPFTIGAFPPGFYRVRTVTDGDPPFIDAGTEFRVTAGPTAGGASANLPQTDLSGIWTAASEPFTGFAFIHSSAVTGQARVDRVTGLWFDYSNSTATWTELLLDSAGTPNNYAGQIVRAVPTGTGASRSIALVPIGTASLTRLGDSDDWRLAGTLEGRAFDLPLQRFRYTRAAFPGLLYPP